MKLLAENNFWVNGCADSFGENEIQHLRGSSFCKMLFNEPHFTILTNKNSYTQFSNILHSYQKKEKDMTLEYKESLKKCDIFYWTSFDQYSRFIKLLPELKEKPHACGLGKTFEQFKKHSINPIVFPRMKDFTTLFKS